MLLQSVQADLNRRIHHGKVAGCQTTSWTHSPWRAERRKPPVECDVAQPTPYGVRLAVYLFFGGLFNSYTSQSMIACRSACVFGGGASQPEFAFPRGFAF